MGAQTESLARRPVDSSARTPKLQVRHVSKVFVSPESGGEFVALRDVSLEASDKEFVCLLGPSGCGKTTLLNMIAGFIEPTEGEVSVDGTRVSGADSDRGVVFQDYALFPWLTAHKNVQFGPRVRGLPLPDREALADKYLGMVGMLEFGLRYPHQLSGGMKQRVAIARALANQPSVLLMDEPFGALDAMTRDNLQDELRELALLEPKLIIFITHSVPEAVFLADRIIVMGVRPGHIMADITVPLPHMRDRTAPEVTEYEREIRALLAPHSKRRAIE